MAVAPAVVADSERPLRPLIDRHLDQVQTLKKPNTYRKYQAVLDRFSEYFPDRTLESVSFEDLNDFIIHLKKGGLEDNTVLHKVVYHFWSDVNLDLRTVRVTAKRDLAFSPKRWEEREVPITSKLAEFLRNHPRTSNVRFLRRPATGSSTCSTTARP